MKTGIMPGMHLLLAALAILISLVLAAWQVRPAAKQAHRRGAPSTIQIPSGSG